MPDLHTATFHLTCGLVINTLTKYTSLVSLLKNKPSTQMVTM